MERTDEELVAAATTGDRSALDQLLRRHYDRIYNVCRRIAGNEADALDATQEALITIARRLERFDGRSSFATWSYRVATNACLDELRRRKRRPDPTDDETMGHHLSTADYAQDDVAERIVAIDSMTHALDELDDTFRLAVVMRDVLDLDYAEIADQLGIPVGTVKSRIARGRAALAKIVGTTGGLSDVQPGDHV